MPKPGHFDLLDEIKRLALIALASDDFLVERLVLKGGVLVDLVLGASPRSSIDLDFSIENDFESIVELETRVRGALERTFDEHGLLVFDLTVREVPDEISDDLKTFWGGYCVEFKIMSKSEVRDCAANRELMRKRAIAINANGSPRFRIEISKHEYCEDRKETLFDDYRIQTYSPQLAVIEKLRAICQQMAEYNHIVKRRRGPGSRGRARDFIDIYSMATKYSMSADDETFQKHLMGAFGKKRVPLPLIGKIGEHREFHRADFQSVLDTVRPGRDMKPFDFYFDFVLEFCKPLKSLWDL